MATAVEHGRLGRNPCRLKGAGLERSPERPLPTGDEVWQLADAIEPRYRALVLTAAFVGLRWGELLGLRRADIDLSARLIHVSRQIIEVDGRLQDGPPKSAAGVRSVAMPPVVAAELDRTWTGSSGSVTPRRYSSAPRARPRARQLRPIGRGHVQRSDARISTCTICATSRTSPRRQPGRAPAN